MTDIRSWLPIVALCALAGLAPLAAAHAETGPVVLEDSTTFESYRLPNGLRVATRHIPGCQHVDVTVAYDFGRSDEPKGEEGMSALLAELEFYGATAETPERSRAEMPGLRPAGWDVAVAPRVTRFSEIAPERLLPGLIHQAADRMRGVRVTQTAYKRALGAVRADLDTAYRLNVGLALHNAARAWGSGSGASPPPEAVGRGIQGLSVRELQQRLDATYVPSNAVLAVVGNLHKIPLRALVQTEFGSIPAGSPVRRSSAARLDSTTRAVARHEVSRPMGVLGLIAPALEDSTHAAFYMELVLVAGHCVKRWGPPEAPLTTRFNYSIYDDPELARFYPPVGPAETDPALMHVSFVNTLNDLSSMKVTPSSYYALWRGLNWLLGGPLPTEMFDRVLREPGALHTLATGTAVRELWGGEPFWSQYRERFQKSVGTPYPEWYKRLLAPRYMVNVLFVPAK